MKLEVKQIEYIQKKNPENNSGKREMDSVSRSQTTIQLTCPFTYIYIYICLVNVAELIIFGSINKHVRYLEVNNLYYNWYLFLFPICFLTVL